MRLSDPELVELEKHPSDEEQPEDIHYEEVIPEDAPPRKNVPEESPPKKDAPDPDLPTRDPSKRREKSDANTPPVQL